MVLEVHESVDNAVCKVQVRGALSHVRHKGWVLALACAHCHRAVCKQFPQHTSDNHLLPAPTHPAVTSCITPPLGMWYETYQDSHLLALPGYFLQAPALRSGTLTRTTLPAWQCTTS